MDETKGSLPIKYRPQTWDEFVGNESTVEALRSILGRKKGISHCIMFEGPSGCGKTTLALLVAKELGCSQEDVRKYNLADMRGIDTARAIIQQARYAPLQGSVKVYILDEAHKMTNEFANAMLEVFEFTPDHVYFILCTTEPTKILPTIRNQRAQVFPVNRLPRPVMIEFLKKVSKDEGVAFEEKFYKEIANVSEGSPRAGLAIMDKIIDIPDDEEAFNAIASATFDEVEVKKIIDYLMEPGKKNWKKMAEMIKGLDLAGSKAEEIRVGIARYFGSVLLNKGDAWSHKVMVVFGSEPWFYSGREKLIDALYELCRQ